MSHAQAARKWAQGAAKRIARRVRPIKIILFGSCAYGRPGPDSDVDLLVILKRRGADRFKSYLRVERAVGEHIFPLDLLVRDTGEIQSRLAMGDLFIQDILKRGKVLYPRAARSS